MEYRDYYKTLGIPRTASQGEIKKAFRKLARVHHPDVSKGDTKAEQRFKDVNEANAVLGDPEKRKQYDAVGANWEAFSRAGAASGRSGASGGGSPFGGFGDGAGQTGNVRYEFRTSSGEDVSGFSDFFRAVFGAERETGASGGRGSRTASGSGSLEETLARMGIDGASVGAGRAGGSRAAQGRVQPPVAEAIAELDLDEAFHGTTRLVDVGGRRLEVSIPKGVDTGSRIRLTGKGPDGGDLVVVVRLTPHPTFTRRGADLERELPLTLEEALLGAAVPVTTLKGRLELTVPAGTQNGRTFRLTGQGMPRLKGAGSGDLYVKTRVVLPVGLSDEATSGARRLFELVKQTDPRSARPDHAT